MKEIEGRFNGTFDYIRQKINHKNIDIIIFHLIKKKD